MTFDKENMLDKLNNLRKQIEEAFKIAKKANKTSVTPPVIFWDLWYHSPALRQYFQELLQDSMQCQNQFDMKILNQFLRQSTPRFTSGPLYHLGTIAHNKFRNYKSLHGNE